MDDLGVPPMLGNLHIWWVVSNTFMFNDHDPDWLLQYVQGGNHELRWMEEILHQLIGGLSHYL